MLDEGLLLRGSWPHIAWALATAFAGAALLACGIRGFALAPLDPVRRVVAAAAGLLMIGPGVYPALIGAALAVLAITPWPDLLRLTDRFRSPGRSDRPLS